MFQLNTGGIFKSKVFVEKRPKALVQAEVEAGMSKCSYTSGLSPALLKDARQARALRLRLEREA